MWKRTRLFCLSSDGRMATSCLSKGRSSVAIKTIPLSRLEADPRGTLTECADSGEAFVVELPGDRFIAIQPLDPGDDDSLMSDLLESNEAFRALVAKSKASARKPFSTGC